MPHKYYTISSDDIVLTIDLHAVSCTKLDGKSYHLLIAGEWFSMNFDTKEKAREMYVSIMTEINKLG